MTDKNGNSQPTVGKDQILIRILDPHNEPVAQVILDGEKLEVHLAKGYVAATEWSEE